MDVPTAMRGGIRTLRAKCEVLISGGTDLIRPVMNAPNAQSPWLMPRLGRTCWCSLPTRACTTVMCPVGAADTASTLVAPKGV